MKKQNTINNSVWKKIAAVFFAFAFVSSLLALPGTGATNLQTTTGVTTLTAGSTLTVTAPNRAILSWQQFGSGTNTISSGDRIEYSLPSANSSVLNIVNVGSTTINGTIQSNGKVYVLNPNGIIVGPTGIINTNGFYASTVDDPSISSVFWNTTGKLPSEDGIAISSLTNGITISDTAILSTVGNNITLVSKAVNVGGAIVNGDLIVNTLGGGAIVGSATTTPTVLSGNLTVNTAGGNVALTPVGQVVVNNGGVTINTVGTTVSGDVSQGTGTLTTNALTVSAKDATISRLLTVSGNVTANGNNVSITNTGTNTNFGGTIAGNLTLSGANVNLSNVSVSGTGDTVVNATSRLSLGSNIGIGSTGNTTFTAPSIVDTANKIFVYGPVSFNTTGDVAITKANHSFGPISLAVGGNATVTEDATLNLNRVAVVGTLTATSTNEVVQFNPTSRVVAGATTLKAVNVTLNDPVVLNNFGALSVTTTGNATLTQARNTTLGNWDVGGLLTVDTSGVVGGTITQTVGTKVNAFNGLSLKTNNGNVDVSQPTNTFGGVTIATGTGTINLAEGSTTNIQSLTGGATTVVSSGDIFNSGLGTTVVGPLNLTAGGKITLTDLVKTTNLTFKAGGVTDLSAMSFATNLGGVYPTNLGTATFLPPKP